VVAGLLAVLVAGCGGGEETQAGKTVPASQAAQEQPSKPESREPQLLWVALDGWESAETLGLVMAEKSGYFEKLRLELNTLAPVTPALSIPDVINGSDQIGVGHTPQAIVARAKGAPIVIVGSLVSQPTAAMIWPKKSNIHGIADLKGKTIAIPGVSFQRDFLESILARGGLTLEDVKVKKVGNDLVPALVNGKADAIFGGSGNVEGANLASRGLEPVVTPVGDLGVPPYEELVLVAREDTASEISEVMHDFVGAVVKGATAAADDPKGAIDALRSAGEGNPETSERARRVEVSQTLPLLSQSGDVDPGEMEDLVAWMYEQGMIQTKVPVSELIASP
jgi:putative hydroxymethylpyrimidine transport system substrate-binding protein